MLCEIEFMPVGNKSSAGDAIIVRYGQVNAYNLMLIDGGMKVTGEEVVSHLKKHFGDTVGLTDVVLTHSDIDHASGLRTVLEELPVGRLWLHVPWVHAVQAKSLFKNKGWTDTGLADAVRAEYSVITELVDIANHNGIPIFSPFEGQKIGPFTVLSPSWPRYAHLLAQFDRTPEPDQTLIEQNGLWIGKEATGLQRIFERMAAAAQKWLSETWGVELLRDGGQTSPSNESSVILYAAPSDEHRALLTGDAGIRALTWAADYADRVGLPLRTFGFAQIPHHGSRRNVGPTILNRLFGPPAISQGAPRFTAFVSAPADDEKHPRQIVLNAFMRRGARVIATQGNSKVYYGGFPARNGYVDATPMQFSSRVEAYD